jgi:hypothetical protein
LTPECLIFSLKLLSEWKSEVILMLIIYFLNT